MAAPIRSTPSAERAARIPLALAVFGLFTVLGGLFAGQSYLASRYAVSPIEWRQALELGLAAWYVRGAVAVPTYAVARRWPIVAGRIAWAVPLHLVFAVTVAIAEQVILLALFAALAPGRGARPSAGDLLMNFMLYWLVVVAAHGVATYSRAQQSALLTARLESQLTKARLELLRAQLHPHFLFNTLHGVAELMHVDVERADLMLTSLADLLRMALQSPSASDVPLRLELDFVRRYLELQQMRFDDRLTVRIDAPEELLDARVPYLVLQPLVENAIRHGVGQRTGPAIVTIRARREGAHLRLEVLDDGPGAIGEPHDGLGLTIARAQLAARFGADCQLALHNVADGGLAAIVEIPHVTDSDR
jgi:two-component system LytT family sensor kinase